MLRQVQEEADALPPRIYKYRSLKNENRTFTKQLIIEREIYFASHSSLNDPFDCRPFIHSTTSPESRKKHFQRMSGAALPGAPRAKRRRWAREVNENLKSEDFLATSVRDVLASRGIFSASVNYRNILMWSHYADAHRGVCVAIDFGSILAGGFGPFPVTYTETRPHLNAISEPGRAIVEKGLLTKSLDWQYEQEWRAIATNYIGKVQLPERAITAVILGALIDATDQREVRNWAYLSGSSIPLYQARFKDDVFGLDFEHIA